ncbi:hypothetical protein GMORB2_1995 [Geosmithia morbida]|uniref:Inheritance of peroxisomes protein 1 n=1 Tax=Geosmithia morbida TaxID=1094350 RepID=A0A9P4YS96_9HYPO|nr:uncharacterized protein GMORB2_1995 [Geosmithia morbida]KAF4121587.1 hypothetical protein GMORB2_1995 [Geosmithia morbida]
MNSMESSPRSTRGLRRASSASATQQPCSKASEAAEIETLFVYPDIKIVSFTTNLEPMLPKTEGARQRAGTLASGSRLERTIAMGLLRIYRAPGSVAFLSCGSALQPILPKSQCWCINENNSQFVLQIRWPSFWRIEMPLSNEEHEKKAEELKEVLNSILQFEKTPCPFQRSFTVELPEEPSLPIKKKPWTPKNSPSPKIPGSILPLFENDGEVRKARHFSLPRLWTSDLIMSPMGASTGDEASPTSLVKHPRNETQDGLDREDLPVASRLLERPQGGCEANRIRCPKNPKASIVTAGADLSSHAHSPDATRRVSGIQEHTVQHFAYEVEDLEGRSSQGATVHPSYPVEDDSHFTTYVDRRFDGWEGPNKEQCLLESGENLSESSSCPSRNSFQSVESWQPNYDQRPPFPAFSSDPQQGSDEQEATSLKAEQSTPSVEESTKKSTSTGSPVHDFDDDEWGSKGSSSHFHRAPETSLSVPQQRNNLSRQRSIPLFLIEKTYDALLTPPAHLIAIILKVAAKLSAGEWRGKVYGYDSGGEQIRVQWDYSEDDMSD